MALRFPNPKDPRDIANYAVDFAGLIPTTDTIASTTCEVISGDDTLDIEGTTVSDTSAVALLSGGTDGASYTLEFEVVLASGLRFNRSAVLKVKDL